MTTPKTNKARVNRSVITKKKIADRVGALDAVVAAGAASPEVTGSPIGTAALADLKTANATMRTTMVSHLALVVSYRASSKAMLGASAALETATGAYMNVVDNIAAGDAAVITRAGLDARELSARIAEPDVPTNLHGEKTTVSCQAIAAWDAAAGAGSYRLKVNFTPSDPTKWQELSPGTSRRRTVTAPSPAMQFLASVASVGSEDSSDWCEPVMLTSR